MALVEVRLGEDVALPGSLLLRPPPLPAPHALQAEKPLLIHAVAAVAFMSCCLTCLGGNRRAAPPGKRSSQVRALRKYGYSRMAEMLPAHTNARIFARTFVKSSIRLQQDARTSARQDLMLSCTSRRCFAFRACAQASSQQIRAKEAEVGCQQPAKYCRLFCKQGILLEDAIHQCVAGCQAKFSAVLTQMQAFVRGGCCESRDA